MNQFLILAQADAESGIVQKISKTFGLSPQLFFSQLVVFFIVCYAMKRFAWGPVLEMLELRRQRIQESMENADKIKDELAKTEAARDELLQNANQQATQLIEEARAAVNRLKETETQKAVNSAEQIIAKAREATEADRSRMLTELKQEIGQLVVQVTAKVSGKVLSAADQKKLIEQANKELAA